MKPLIRLIVLAPMVLAACAGTMAPTANVAASQAAIRSARELGAEQDPTAALYLQYAREEFAQSDQLSRDGNSTSARGALLRAQADAELALALARQSSAHAAAAQAADQTRSLQSQTP